MDWRSCSKVDMVRCAAKTRGVAKLVMRKLLLADAMRMGVKKVKRRMILFTAVFSRGKD
jgi:hypothetical protein